ncbi:MAG: ferrous iron transport protein A [Gammaproteobacteria bacterium]|nr:ferrous iron transport protein A [Gammaproteobacteria bacterium]
MTLDQLNPGQRGIITDIDEDGPVAQRLMAMGLLEGTKIAMTRKALGGDPIEVEVMGYSLSLRKAEAHRISIMQSL